MRKFKIFVLTIMVLLSFNGCDKKEITDELQKVHWDRDMCSRCKMVTSDRHHTVQIINLNNGKSYMFDDIGCTILWFSEENISWHNNAKIWITDANSGKWIDAKKAFYDNGNLTPMAYGFMAHKNIEDIPKSKKVFSYIEIIPKIKEIDNE